MMMRPDLRSTMPGAKARRILAVPVRLVSIVVSQSSSVISSNGWNCWIPALAKSTSTRPREASISRAARCTALRSRWSRVTACQRTPCASTRSPVALRSSGVDGVTPERGSATDARSIPATSAPAAARAIAAARPMPRAAPVTTAVLPRRAEEEKVGLGAVSFRSVMESGMGVHVPGAKAHSIW